MKRASVVTFGVMMLITGAAYAGLQVSIPVTIDFDFGVVQGDMRSARTAKNDFESIGCGARRSAGGFEFGFCQARDADDTLVLCTTFDPVLIDEIGSIGEFGFISFNFVAPDPENNPDQYDCTSIRWSKQSHYLPNFTTKGSN